MVVFDDLDPVGEAEGHGQLHLVFIHVRAVLTRAFSRLEERGGRQRVIPGQLLDIVHQTILIEVGYLLKFTGGGLIAKQEGDPSVDHRLALHRVAEVVSRDVGLHEDLPVRLPANRGAGMGAPGGGLCVQAADILTLLEVQGIPLAIPDDHHIHVLTGILGGAGTQAIETQCILIVSFPAILAAGVELAENQLPVVPLLGLIPVHRAATPLVIHLDGAIQIAGQGDQRAVARPGLVNGIGQDLKNGVLTALQAVRTEDNAGALPDASSTFEGRNRLVAVFLFWHIKSSPFEDRNYILCLRTKQNAKRKAPIPGAFVVWRHFQSKVMALRSIYTFLSVCTTAGPISGCDEDWVGSYSNDRS